MDIVSDIHSAIAHNVDRHSVTECSTISYILTGNQSKIIVKALYIAVLKTHRPAVNKIFMRRVLAYNIAFYRENLGISQTELARMVNLTQQQVSDIERAKRYVEDICEALAIALALQISVGKLFVPPRDLSILSVYIERRSRKRRRENAKAKAV